MSDEPDPTSPLPDSVPETPPPATPPAPSGPNLGQRLARLSWWACFLAIILNFLVAMIAEPYPALAAVALNALLLLIAIALVFALIALLGIPKWGREDIVRPALVGLLLSLAMIGLMGNAIFTRRNEARELERRAAEQRQQLEQQSREVLMESGWLGSRELDGAIVTLSSISEDNRSFSPIRSKLGTDVSPVLVLARNFGSTDMTVDTAGAVAALAGGDEQTALDVVKLLESVESDREAMMRAYSPPLRVPAGGRASTLLFLPSSIDWPAVQSITVKVNGVDQLVPGQYLTREQKLLLIRAATQAASRPATQAQ